MWSSRFRFRQIGVFKSSSDSTGNDGSDGQTSFPAEIVEVPSLCRRQRRWQDTCPLPFDAWSVDVHD